MMINPMSLKAMSLKAAAMCPDDDVDTAFPQFFFEDRRLFPCGYGSGLSMATFTGKSFKRLLKL